MLNRKITVLYSLPIVLMSVLVGMIVASRLGLSPATSAQTVPAPPMNSAPLNGPISASTFRDIAKLASPAVVNIRTESRQRTQDLSDFFGGGGGGDLFERFFGQPNPRGQGPGGAAKGSGSSRASSSCRRPAPGSSSTRRASSSPTTTSWTAPPRLPCRSTARTRTRSTRPGWSAAIRSPTARSSSSPKSPTTRFPRSSSATPRRCSRATG